MIKSFTFINYLGDSIYVDLFNPEPTGFAITNVEGLGPVRSTINTTPISTGDGSIYNSARKEERNIVFTIMFFQSDDYATIEDIRQQTYRFFPLKKPVTVLIETDNRKLYTVGYVESNEPNIFSEEEDTQISIICPDSDFYGYDPSMQNHGDFLNIRRSFQFPFSNEGLDPILVFGEIIDDDECVIYYDGDSEIGLTLTIEFYNRPMHAPTYITISKIDTSEQFTIDLQKLIAAGYMFYSGDKIVISTTVGSKKVVYVESRFGQQEQNILNSIGRNVTWFTLHKGENIFVIDSDFDVGILKASIDYVVAYEGI